MSKENVISERIKSPGAPGLTLWINVDTSKDYAQPYIRISKQYKGKDSNTWKDTEFLKESDLLALGYLATAALDACTRLRQKFDSIRGRGDAPSGAATQAPAPSPVKSTSFEQDDIPF